MATKATTIPERYSNIIPANPPLSWEARARGISLLMQQARKCIEVGRNGFLAAHYCDAIANGYKIKGFFPRGNRFFAAARRSPTTWKLILDHTEENQANWISEIMYAVTPEKTSRGIVSADYSFMDGIFIWTYRNGLNQICDREGNPVSEPVATSPALPYVQCKRLRQK